MFNSWAAIIAGLLLAVVNTLSIFDGGGIFRGFHLPVWTCSGLALCGIFFVILGIRGVRRKKELAPHVYTAEDAQKAEAEMDAMYLRDHGEPPEKNKKHD